MRDAINHIVFGWYPYLCLTVFVLGSLLRFDREQYTWKTGSSQLLRRRQVGIQPISRRHPGDLSWPPRRPADADLDV